MLEKMSKTVIVVAIVLCSFIATTQTSTVALGDVYIMYVFDSPITGQKCAWVLIEVANDQCAVVTLTNGKLKQGWVYGDGKGNVTGEDKQILEPLPLSPFESLPLLFFGSIEGESSGKLVPELLGLILPIGIQAKPNVMQREGSNEVVIETDKPVEIQLIDAQSGVLVGDRVTVTRRYSIDMSPLSMGCKYVVVIYQEVPEYGTVIFPGVGVCKY